VVVGERQDVRRECLLRRVVDGSQVTRRDVPHTVMTPPVPAPQYVVRGFADVRQPAVGVGVSEIVPLLGVEERLAARTKPRTAAVISKRRQRMPVQRRTRFFFSSFFHVARGPLSMRHPLLSGRLYSYCAAVMRTLLASYCRETVVGRPRPNHGSVEDEERMT